MRYFIHLGFDGSDFSGWQRQKDTANTVQEVLEKTLSQLFKQEISAYGCGRTDAGVHASQFIVQIDLREKPSFDLKFRLNKNLPLGIAAFEVIEVDDSQHCRYDATSRTYDYFIHWDRNPGLMRFSSFYDDLTLDFELMKQATALIRGAKDFRLLCKQPDLYNNTLCKITECELFVDEEQGRLRFTITSDRFLRGMVRFCVFFLLKVGSSQLSLEDFEKVLNQDKDVRHKHTAFPNGLFLSKVTYPFLELKESHQFIKMLKRGLE